MREHYDFIDDVTPDVDHWERVQRRLENAAMVIEDAESDAKRYGDVWQADLRAALGRVLAELSWVDDQLAAARVRTGNRR
jgi:lysyl-tRNA synthetase class I